MRIVTFGEVMLRLQPAGYGRFLQATSFDASFGGAEANVAVSLSAFGADAAFLTALPANPIGESCVRALKAHGVDTSLIVRSGSRVGIYYCEKGASQRPSKVVYDRAHSSVSELTLTGEQIANALDGAEWFHISGITPALSKTSLELSLALAKAAKERGITVSVDLNFRKNLWSREDAAEAMGKLLTFADYLVSNEEECKSVFGLEAQGADIEGGKLSKEGYASLSKVIFERFPNLSGVVFTLRTSISASVNKWSGMLATKDGCFFAPEYTMQIVDRVGGGDAFSAGLIFGLSSGFTPQDAINFATAAGCLKHSVEGDFNYVTKEEVLALAAGNGSGRVQR
jgi:2-dehydro-3-deoxygluconokinase